MCSSWQGKHGPVVMTACHCVFDLSADRLALSLSSVLTCEYGLPLRLPLTVKCTATLCLPTGAALATDNAASEQFTTQYGHH